MVRITVSDEVAKTEVVKGAPADLGRRSLIKAGLAASILALWQAEPSWALGNRMSNEKKHGAPPSILSMSEVQAVSPVLAHYAEVPLLNGLWKRRELSPRDRSVVTVATLIARIQSIEMPYHFALALDNGVKPAELSEIITHPLFTQDGPMRCRRSRLRRTSYARGIGADQLPPAHDKLLPLNEEAEKQRATQVGNNFGSVSPGLVQNTTDLLFLDLWLRPALKPRDRSLVTVSALIANGQTGQITYHLGRAMDNGLTQEQAAEVLTHIAFYAGWPCAFSALPVVKDVFEKRQK
jgi:4-carboxymuconolactone decarboxylase